MRTQMKSKSDVHAAMCLASQAALCGARYVSAGAFGPCIPSTINNRSNAKATKEIVEKFEFCELRNLFKFLGNHI